MHQTHIDTADFEPFLHDGSALGEVHWIEKDVSGVFRKKDGELFEQLDYEFQTDALIRVIEGSMRYKSLDGATIILEPGTATFFPKGYKCSWRFEELPFRELFFYT